MNNKGDHQVDKQDHIRPQVEKRPRGKHIHHSWIFWTFVFLMFAAIGYYIVSLNFAVAPQ